MTTTDRKRSAAEGEQINDMPISTTLANVIGAAEFQAARTKPELALLKIDRAVAADVRFGCVLADAGYGLERAVPPIAHHTQTGFGSQYPTATQGESCRVCLNRRVKTAGRSPPSPDIARRPPAILVCRSAATAAMPVLQIMDLQRKAAQIKSGKGVLVTAPMCSSC